MATKRQRTAASGAPKKRRRTTMSSSRKARQHKHGEDLRHKIKEQVPKPAESSPTPETPRDIVDQALEESFPASDSPAYSSRYPDRPRREEEKKPEDDDPDLPPSGD